MDEPFRLYRPDECGPDGYPFVWHDLGDGRGVKHLVREEAGHRCARCRHPFVCGETPGRYSPCDRRCSHKGAVRMSYVDDEGEWMVIDPHELATEAGVVVGYGKTIEAIARVLTVHHLRLGADAKRDLRWWNLCALCQRCHLTIQGRVQMERVWPWPHSEWFKVYAAGWYAHSYLGEDLSRAEVEARLDDLLALELAA